MKDGTGAGEQADVSRQELYDEYVNCYLQSFPEVRPQLLESATQYMLREPKPSDTFTVFPFHQAVSERSEALSADGRKHMRAFIKATELLETLCVNLYLQPWKKEFRTLKTFTGPFVYCLQPVFNSSTIQSILASIGYLPHKGTDQGDAPQSEFRLSEHPDPDRAILVGFELLLARVKCHHLLELLDKEQLGPQDWLEDFHRTVGTTKLEEATEKKITIEQKEEKKKKKEADTKEVPLYSDTRLVVNPHHKHQHSHLISKDQSIMEMHRIYPDLAFRGCPLLPEGTKPHRTKSSRSSSKAVHTAADNAKVAESLQRDYVKGTLGLNDSFSNTDGGSVDDKLSRPHNVSLHITLRTASTAEQGLKPGQALPTAGVQNKGAEPCSLSYMDEEQELRELAERMGQLHMQETKEEVVKERRESAEGEVEEQKLRKPVVEMLTPDASRCTRSSQPDPASTSGCHPPPPDISKAQCQSCEGGSAGQQQEGEDR